MYILTRLFVYFESTLCFFTFIHWKIDSRVLVRLVRIANIVVKANCHTVHVQVDNLAFCEKKLYALHMSRISAQAR